PGLPQRFNEINEGVDDLGSITPTLANVELLLQIDPDVIVSANSMGDFSKPLETIGPVVILTHLDSWKEVMLFGSNLIDERQVAEALLAEYEMRVQILQAQFEDPSEITISYVRLFPESAHVQLSDSFARQIMQDVGFSFPEAQLELVESAPNEIEADFSAERIDLIDGDYLFLYGAQPDQLLENAGTSAETLVEAFQNDPLFQALEVAKANQVYETDLHWSVPGIYSAHAVLDDLFRHVAGVDPEEVAPNPLSLE
ncbi:MAG: ABC transporter substrate-binding protein, partial [Chloroflexota bacterium]